jgi:predicted enzyme related to lactoylglutathione lyase
VEIYRVILPVTDIERAARFYAAVLEIPGERVSPGRHYFDCGGTILACYDPAADGDAVGEGWRPHSKQYLYFAAQDLESCAARVAAAGGQDVTEIRDCPWGERAFYALDPFANPICFVAASTEFRGGGFFR